MAKIEEKGVIEEFKENGIVEEKYRSFTEFIKFEEDLTDIRKLDNLSERLKGRINDKSALDKAMEGISELKHIINAATAGLNFIKYDPLLVRGLGYYTGPIFEIKSKNAVIGSFAAGGRYDNLVELYGARPEGACGISFGVERIIDIIVGRDKEILKSLSSPVKLYIVYLSENERVFALKTAKVFRLKGINTELSVSGEPNIGKEIKYADKKGIEYFALIGEKEASEQKIALKNLKTRKEIFLSAENAAEIIK